MGRPLNKKYFGNRNVGSTSTTADNKIGGEGIASVNWSQLGSFRGNDGAHNPLVGFALPAPTLPGGVQATWSPLFEVATVTTGAGSVGLVVGDTYTYAGLGSPVFTVATSGNDASNATFTVTSRGEFDLTAMPGDTTGVNITKVTGTGAATFLVDIAFRVKSATIVEKGSGYVGTETFSVTLYPGGAGTAPAGTIVVTTDSGSAGSTTNQENAIIGYAYVPTANGGTQRLVCDIVKQTNDRRYKVKTSEGTGICQLVTDGVANAAGELDITAYDSAGGEYWVWKLTSRKVVVVRKGVGGGSQFATGSSVPWTLGNAVEDYSVKIENA